MEERRERLPLPQAPFIINYPHQVGEGCSLYIRKGKEDKGNNYFLVRGGYVDVLNISGSPLTNVWEIESGEVRMRGFSSNLVLGLKNEGRIVVEDTLSLVFIVDSSMRQKIDGEAWSEMKSVFTLPPLPSGEIPDDKDDEGPYRRFELEKRKFLAVRGVNLKEEEAWAIFEIEEMPDGRKGYYFLGGKREIRDPSEFLRLGNKKSQQIADPKNLEVAIYNGEELLVSRDLEGAIRVHSGAEVRTLRESFNRIEVYEGGYAYGEQHSFNKFFVQGGEAYGEYCSQNYFIIKGGKAYGRRKSWNFFEISGGEGVGEGASVNTFIIRSGSAWGKEYSINFVRSIEGSGRFFLSGSNSIVFIEDNELLERIIEENGAQKSFQVFTLAPLPSTEIADDKDSYMSFELERRKFLAVKGYNSENEVAWAIFEVEEMPDGRKGYYFWDYYRRNPDDYYDKDLSVREIDEIKIRRQIAHRISHEYDVVFHKKSHLF